MNKKTAGVLFGLAAGLVWSLEALFVRFSLQESSIVKTTFFTFLFAALIPFLYAAYKKEIRFEKGKLNYLIIIGILGTTVPVFLYYYALTKTQVLNAVLLVHTQPLFMILFGHFILKEKLRMYDYLGGLLFFISALLVTSRTFDNLFHLRLGNMGDIVAVALTILWAYTALLTKKHLIGMNSVVLTFFKFTIAAIPLGLFLLFYGDVRIDTVYQIITGLIIGLGNVFYYESLKRLKTAQLGFLELSAPIFAAMLGFAFLQELLTINQVIGIGVLAAGLYFIGKTEH